MKMVFRETQRFHQAWIWIALLGLDMLFIYAIISQVINDIPFGRSPVPNVLLIVLAIFPIGFTFLFASVRLETRVDELGIRFRFFPIHSKERDIFWTEIEKWSIQTYHPLLDFGGWGIRFGSKSKAYTIAGRQGLQLELKDGRKILIGTQDRESLEEMLKNLKRNYEL